MENRSEQRRRAVLEALARAMEPLITARAKENKVESGKVHGRGKVCQNSDKPIKSIDTKKEAASRAKERQESGKGADGSGGRGKRKNLCQKSDKGFDTKKEAAALAGEGKVALNHGSNPTRASPGTPTLGGQDQRTTDVATHGRGQVGDRAS